MQYKFKQSTPRSRYENNNDNLFNFGEETKETSKIITNNHHFFADENDSEINYHQQPKKSQEE
jgi:hypothetical protein